MKYQLSFKYKRKTDEATPSKENGLGVSLSRLYWWAPWESNPAPTDYEYAVIGKNWYMGKGDLEMRKAPEE